MTISIGTDPTFGVILSNDISATSLTTLDNTSGPYLPPPCEESTAAESDTQTDTEDALEEQTEEDALISEAEDEATAENLPDSETATLYIDSQGLPDLERFSFETSLIAQKKAEEVGQEYPLPVDQVFHILGGDEQGYFVLKDALTGAIAFALPTPSTEEAAVEPEVELDAAAEPEVYLDPGPASTAETDETPSEPERPSTLIRDLAATCPTISYAPAGAVELGITPEIVGYSTWEEVQNDPDTLARVEEEIAAMLAEAEPEEGEEAPATTATEAAPEAATTEPETAEPVSEVEEEMSELVTPTTDFAAQNPEIAAAIEALAASASSTYSLIIGIVFAENVQAANVTVLTGDNGVNINVPEHNVLPNNTSANFGTELSSDLVRESALSAAGQTTVTSITETGETLESLSYTININIDDARVAPQQQVPTATASPAVPCVQTMGAMVGAEGSSPSRASIGPPIPAGYAGLQPIPPLSECAPIVDVRMEYVGETHGENDWSTVEVIVLHQMSCRAGAIDEDDSNAPPGTLGERDAEGMRIKRGGGGGWRRWLEMSMHFFVTCEESSGPQGGPKAYRLVDNNKIVWASHGFNRGRNRYTDPITGEEKRGLAGIGIEIEGKFPGKIADRDSEHIILSARQAEVARQLCACIIAEVAASGGQIKYIAGHRSSYGGKPNDPGEEVWKQIAIPVQEQFGLLEAPTLGTGNPIPEEWNPSNVGVAWRANR